MKRILLPNHRALLGIPVLRYTGQGILMLFFACVFAFPVAMLRAQSAATSPATQSTYYPTKLTLHPSAATQPLSRYRLLPDLVDQTPGNAVTLYMQVLGSFPDAKTTEEILYPENHKFSYEETPIDKFPREYAQRLLAGYSQALNYADLAARRNDAVWDTGWRERASIGSHAFGQFGYLNSLRHIANVLCFRARFQIAEGDWKAADYTFQTEFSMARQVGTQALEIHALIESAFADLALSDGVEEWIARRDSPNLYWELTDLPRPFVELRPVEQWEGENSRLLQYWKPQLWQALHGELPTQQWPQVIREMIGNLQESRPPFKRDPAAAEAQAAERLIKSSFARAHQYLIATGTPKEKADAMSPDQVVGIYWRQEYSKVVDELWRAWALPFWQAQEQMLRSWTALRPDQGAALENPLIQAYLISVGNGQPEFNIPSLLRMRYQVMRADRKIALLRTIEALRDYAARHEGQPPQHLEQITELPLPVDPMTDKPFSYQVEGRSAVLDAPPPAGRSRFSGWTYEITFAK